MHSSTRRCVWCLATVVLLMSSGPHPTEAALVTYQYTGVVTGVTGPVYTARGSGADGFDAGLMLAGQCTFDTMAPHMNLRPLLAAQEAQAPSTDMTRTQSGRLISPSARIHRDLRRQAVPLSAWATWEHATVLKWRPCWGMR